MEGVLAWTLGNIRLDPAVNRNTQYREGSGAHWFLSSEEGFWGSPGNDATLTKKFNRHGATIGPGWKKERTISLEGYVFAPTFSELRKAINQITGLLSNPYEGCKFTCHSEIGDLTCDVFLDGDILTKPFIAATPAATFSLQLVAPDPRKYDGNTTKMSTGLPNEGAGGLDFGPETLGPPPNDPDDGLNFASADSNYFQNPIFEYGLDWWQRLSNTNSEWITVSGVQNNSVGNRGVRNIASGPGAFGMQSPLIPVSAETVITASAYVRSPVATTITMVAGWYDQNGGWLADNISTTPLPQNSWTRISVTTPPKPAGAANYGMASLHVTAPDAGATFDATGFLAENTSTPTGNYNFGSTNDAGLLFGTGTGSSGQLYMKNNGTAPSEPVFRLYGPLTNPALSADGTYTMKYNGTVAAGDFIEIDPSAPSVMINGLTSRRHLLSPAQFSGFTVPASGTLIVGLTHEGPSTDKGYVEVTYRHAWF